MDIYKLYNLIGKNFKKIRKEKIKLTQEKLAETLNISRSFISHIESPNVNKGLSIDTLFLISQKYNIDIREFFKGYETFMKNNDNNIR